MKKLILFLLGCVCCFVLVACDNSNEHINYVIECLKNNTTKIGNIRSYLLTALYNSYTTQDHYYRAEVNHDFYG